MEQPQLTLDTKFGALTLTFLYPLSDGPTDRYGNARAEREQHVLQVTGEIVVNRIPVRVSTRLAYSLTHYKGGKELAEPLRELGEDYQCSYHRRTDVTFGGEVTSGVRNKLRELWEGVVREAYEAHPEMHREAQRWHLWYKLDRATAERDTAYAAYMKAEEAVRDARIALDDFDE